jgi:hypothetical protein
MNFRRKQTTVQTDHPIRFYKIVALTFLVITLILFGVVVFMSSKRATITITTKAEPIEVRGNVGINDSSEAVHVSGSVATTTVSVSRLFQPTGSRKEDGVATGIITIHNNTGADQPLVATTRFINEDNVLFRLKERVTAPANGTVDAEVYADEEGPQGEIGPSRFTIPGLSLAKQEDIYGVSDVAMTGGTRTIGILSSADIEKAEVALRDELLEEGKALFAKTPDMLGVFELSDFSAKADAEVGTEVAGFTLSGNAIVTGILYDADDVQGYADTLLQTRAIDDASIIKPADVPPAVRLVQTDLEKGTATLEIINTGTATLNPDGKQLDKIMLYGKTKDEVRRYLLSLSHVFGVEVDFKPAWMRTVPHVADHVRVVVKNIE